MDEIKRGIESVKYKEKQKLPSEFQLSRDLGVSRATLREALRMLEEDNIVMRRHGVGTFVKPKPVYSSGIEQLSSVTYMIEQSGKHAGSQLISSQITEPGAEDKEYFELEETGNLIKIERIRTADGEPVVFCIDKLPAELIELENVKKDDSLFKLLEVYTGRSISYAVTNIEPVSYQSRVYEKLGCHPEQPLLLLKQMHYTEEDEPVLYSVNYFRPDFFQFYVLRKRM